MSGRAICKDCPGLGASCPRGQFISSDKHAKQAAPGPGSLSCCFQGRGLLLTGVILWAGIVSLILPRVTLTIPRLLIMGLRCPGCREASGLWYPCVRSGSLEQRDFPTRGLTPGSPSSPSSLSFPTLYLDSVKAALPTPISCPFHTVCTPMAGPAPTCHTVKQLYKLSLFRLGR